MYEEYNVDWNAVSLIVTASAISWHRNSPEIYAQSPSRLFYKNPRNVPSELCPRYEAQGEHNISALYTHNYIHLAWDDCIGLKGGWVLESLLFTYLENIHMNVIFLL